MLTLIVGGDDYWNEETEQFETHGHVEVVMEHSLLSLSKWESKYQKPFLSSAQKNTEEILHYIQCMILFPENPRGEILAQLSQKQVDQITEYIESTQSATTFGDMPQQRGRGETVTSELIYYWMVAFNIPFETESWHLNRLFALIRICNVKQQKPKKMNKGEMSRRYQELNAQRKAQLGTTG